jgi:hypothetical protein
LEKRDTVSVKKNYKAWIFFDEFSLSSKTRPIDVTFGGNVTSITRSAGRLPGRCVWRGEQAAIRPAAILK